MSNTPTTSLTQTYNELAIVYFVTAILEIKTSDALNDMNIALNYTVFMLNCMLSKLVVVVVVVLLLLTML